MKASFLVVFVFFRTISNSQINIFNQSLTDSTLKIVYSGVQNLIVVKGFHFRIGTKISAENANLTANGDSSFILIPKYGFEKCSIGFLNPHTDAVEIREIFRIDTLPEPVARLGYGKIYYPSDPHQFPIIKLADILEYPIVWVNYPNSFYRPDRIITRFRITISKDNTIAEAVSNQPTLNKEQIEYIKSAGPGSILTIEGIILRDVSGKQTKLKPLAFIIN